MLRGPKPLVISSWRGHNTFEHKEEIAPDFWIESNNVIVNSSGHAEALRSPKTFKADLSNFTNETEYDAAVMVDTPVVYYKLDETSGNPQDSSGNAFHGTHANTPTYNAPNAWGFLTGAITYNGTNEYTVSGNITDLDDTFSFELWVNTGSVSGKQPLITGAGTFGPALYIAAGGKVRLLKIGTGDIVESTVALSVNTWAHVVCTKTGSTVKLYINGVDVTGTVTNQTIATGVDQYNIARAGVGFIDAAEKFYGGSIDEVAIYSTALSAARVLAHYRGDSGDIHGLEHFDSYHHTGNGLVIDKGDDTLFVEGANGTAGSVYKLRSDQSGDPFTSLMVTKPIPLTAVGIFTKLTTLMRCDGTEFIQYVFPRPYYCFDVGITPPAVAPTLSFNASADTGTLAVGVKVSYSYFNSLTGHVSFPSPISASSGPKAANFDLRITWTASAQTGVDYVIFFITTDGGEVPYSYLWQSGDYEGTAFFVANDSSPEDIKISDLDALDTLTPEPIYNTPPPTDATFMFEWKERVFLVTSSGSLRYSGLESCTIGQPTESYPILNEYPPPGSDSFVGGIGTQLGALVFGNQDSYLISGSPSDKTSGPQNVNAVTEKITPMRWDIGIRDPRTAAKSPFGIIWVDDTSKLRMWELIGYPYELAEGLRAEIKAMTGTLRGKWYDRGDTAGMYVLTNGTTTLFVTIRRVGGKLEVGCGKSDTTTGPIAVAKFRASADSSLLDTDQFFFTRNDDVFEWLDPDTAGDGWPADTDLSFALVAGNDINFSKLHSIQVTGETDEVSVVASDVNGAVQEDVVLEEDIDTDNSRFAIVDTEWRRHKLTFEFAPSDTYQSVDTLRVILKPKKRII